MMFEKPYCLLLILLIIPALIVVAARFLRTMALFTHKGEGHKDAAYEKRDKFEKSDKTEKGAPHTMPLMYKNLKSRFVARTLLWTLSFACLVIALAMPYWGTEPVAVQKNGCAVSFVFDVSHSMLAADTKSGATRLSSAGEYATQLLSRMGGMSVSVVLAKGSGVLTIPLTDDFTGITPLLANLSPALLTTPGTDVASGVEAAVRSFPPTSAQTASIVLFTDGDETASSLKAAVMAAADYGISVVIVGFGATEETEVMTGDGVRTAKTALREKELQKICKEAAALCAKKYGMTAKDRICYVNAEDVSSALTVLKTVSYDTYDAHGIKDTANQIVLYEEEPIARSSFFMALALFFYALGFTVNEWNRNAFGKKADKTATKTGSAALIVLLSMFLSSCNAQTKTAATVLSGVLYWSTEDYDKAAAAFEDAEHLSLAMGDDAALPYAEYGRASAYLMQNETEAALEALAQVPANAPPLVQFGALYNSGIIAYRAGDFTRAAERFKQALLVDSTNRNAKINLELSMNKLNVQTGQSAQSTTPINETPAVDSAVQAEVFSIIREQEQNQWKSREKQTDSSVLDY